MRINIYDCFMLHNELDLLEIRLNILDEFVDYFVIIESGQTHAGYKKNFQFNLNDFAKFRHKIIYSKIENFPQNFTPFNRENFQRNYIMNSLTKANDEDFILISDLDEIPNLKNLNFETIKKKIIVFNQRLFMYKLNYGEQKPTWHGTKCCKKKYLKSPQWLRTLKTHKRYKFFRIDKIFLSKNYENSFDIIENGGWHFSWIGEVDFIKEKINSMAHRDINNSSINNDENINDHIKKKKSLNFNQNLTLKKLPINNEILPEFIVNNLEKFSKHID